MPADFTANTALVRRCQQGDPAAAEALLSLNEPLVYTIAARYHRDGGPCELADLLQEGRLGLLRAAQKFDPARGVAFGSYATWWIRQAVSRAVRLTGGLIHVPLYLPPDAPRPQVASLDAPIGAEAESTLADLVPDPFDLEAAVVARLAARQWLAALKPRERLVLEQRFGLDGEPQTLAAIGQALHLHPERVRQLQCRALARLKEAAGTPR